LFGRAGNMAQSHPSKSSRVSTSTKKVAPRKSNQKAIRKSQDTNTTAPKSISRWRDALLVRLKRVEVRRRAFLSRRPHKSFRRTRRRDYSRSLKLPGYHAFTLDVFTELKARRRTMGLLVVFYAVLLIVLGGVTNQESYAQINQLLDESSSTLAEGGWDKVGQAGLLLVATFASGPSNLSADQQIYLASMLIFVWLSTVWLLREYKLGRTPKLRDGLYNSGAPFISTLLVVLVLICQLLPIGIVALIYVALSSVGIVSAGFGSMLFWVFATVVACLVLYWVMSTLIALVVVTLPGMYPIRALRAASDLVVGRRLRIMYRILWMLGTVAIGWLVVMIPLVILTTWMTNIFSWMASVPLMPLVAALMTALTVVWISSYIYILYRKVVDDGAAPA